MGQTPKVPYVKERTHFSFRYWWEYSGGTMTDWGAHHNDIVLWTLGLDQSGPVSIEGKQLVEMIPGGFTAASEYEVTYTYANGVVHTSKSTTASEWHGGVKDPNGQQHGIKFIGSDGWIWVTRGILQASDRQLRTDKLPESAPRVYVSNDYIANFIDCVKTRKPPICPAEVGHRSASLCHLGVISIRLGRKLNWDPAREQFVGDAEAATYLAREMRKPYDYDLVGPTVGRMGRQPPLGRSGGPFWTFRAGQTHIRGVRLTRFLAKDPDFGYPETGALDRIANGGPERSSTIDEKHRHGDLAGRCGHGDCDGTGPGAGRRQRPGSGGLQS